LQVLEVTGAGTKTYVSLVVCLLASRSLGSRMSTKTTSIWQVSSTPHCALHPATPHSTPLGASCPDTVHVTALYTPATPHSTPLGASLILCSTPPPLHTRFHWTPHVLILCTSLRSTPPPTPHSIPLGASLILCTSLRSTPPPLHTRLHWAPHVGSDTVHATALYTPRHSTLDSTGALMLCRYDFENVWHRYHRTSDVAVCRLMVPNGLTDGDGSMRQSALSAYFLLG
jgi:hypothetical protein